MRQAPLILTIFIIAFSFIFCLTNQFINFLYHLFIISITTLMAETIAAAISKQRHSHFGTLFPSQKTLYFKNIESRFLFFTSWTANHAITKMQIVPKTASSCPSASTPPRYGIGKTSNITQFHIRLICANRISRIKTQHKHQKGIAISTPYLSFSTSLGGGSVKDMKFNTTLNVSTIITPAAFDEETPASRTN